MENIFQIRIPNLKKLWNIFWIRISNLKSHFIYQKVAVHMSLRKLVLLLCVVHFAQIKIWNSQIKGWQSYISQCMHIDDHAQCESSCLGGQCKELEVVYPSPSTLDMQRHSNMVDINSAHWAWITWTYHNQILTKSHQACIFIKWI